MYNSQTPTVNIKFFDNNEKYTKLFKFSSGGSGQEHLGHCFSK